LGTPALSSMVSTWTLIITVNLFSPCMTSHTDWEFMNLLKAEEIGGVLLVQLFSRAMTSTLARSSIAARQVVSVNRRLRIRVRIGGLGGRFAAEEEQQRK
jgi:hypothetical protein